MYIFDLRFLPSLKKGNQRVLGALVLIGTGPSKIIPGNEFFLE